MFRPLPLLFGLPLLVVLPGTVAVDHTSDPSLIADLKSAASHLDRSNLVKDDRAYLFDYSTQPFWNATPGGVINANLMTFPASEDQELSMAWINLDPCAMLPAHFHPRAVNWVTAISGETTTYMLTENGANWTSTVLTYAKATFFPRGSIHMMINHACEKAVLISALSSTDPGTTNINQVFKSPIPHDELNAALGTDCVDDQTAQNVPPIGTGANWGTDECMAKCGITRGGGSSTPSNNSTSSMTMRMP